MGLFIILIFFVWGVYGFMVKMRETQKNKKESEAKVTQLEKSQAKLSTDINKLQTPGGIEEDIRDKFGLAKEGEGMIVVVEDKNSPAIPAENKGGFFSFFMNWFK